MATATLRHGALKVRTRTTFRYVVVVSPGGNPAQARVEYRTDDLPRAQAHARRKGWATRLVFDTTTGHCAGAGHDPRRIAPFLVV